MGKNKLELSRAFAILGVQANTTPELVHRTYRQLVKRWHPDQFGLNTRAHSEAEARLKLINQAYAIVKAHLKTHPQAKPVHVRPGRSPQHRFNAPKSFFHTLFGPTAQRPSPPLNSKPAPPSKPATAHPGFQQILQTAHQHPKHFKSGTVVAQLSKKMAHRHPLRHRRGGAMRIEGVRPVSRVCPVSPIAPIGDDD